MTHLKLEGDIKLVKLEKNYKYYSKRIAPILFWKVPDAMVTLVKNGVEYPLVLIELSSSVFTEDHELQRFDGLVAAARNNCFYVKISPSGKTSPSKHGGNIKFDYAIPYSIIQKRFGKTFFYFDWKCDKNGVVEVDENYLSCPKRIEPFELLLSVIISKAVERELSEEWMNSVVETLAEDSFFSHWFTRLKNTPDIDVTKLKTSRTRWMDKDEILKTGALELKINRFGHAMDPERGMLAYYGSMGKPVVSKMRFSETNNAWYKDIPEEERIRNYIGRNGLRTAYDFLYCFALGSGLHENREFMEIAEKYRERSLTTITIDLTDFIRANFAELSKPLKTIFLYSVIFIIEDAHSRRRVIFKWVPYNESLSFIKHLDVTPIEERRILEEDDVTYITIHNILRPNNYKIIAVSYPGAQGDRRILIQMGTGRRQPRKYVDIISFLPRKFTSLQENKGEFSKTEIQKDIYELSKYKGDKHYINGLKEFQKRFASESLETPVKIGVGFWSSKSFTVSRMKDLDIRELDYFVYITEDRKQWFIWSTGPNDMFEKVKGMIEIPKTYNIISRTI
ncbi:MAG: hypothetical protein QW385_04180 [Thermoproteota archaeon]